jgi:penicillin-binding protein 1A
MSEEVKASSSGCRRVLVRLLIVLVVITALMVAVGAVWLQREVLAELPDVGGLVAYRPPRAARVLDRHGVEVDTFYVERRYWVPIDALPEHLIAAFVAAEDERFFSHPGVDPTGVLRALRANWDAGGVVQGGSTITQQLVKNLLVGRQRTLRRKLKEAVLAVRLEQLLDKRSILELYLNYVFLGGGNHGIEAASRSYFGLSAREVNVAQAALLAGLVPAPSRYAPRRHPRAAAARREHVLGRMVETGQLSMREMDLALRTPVLAPPADPVATGGISYITAVRQEIRRVVGAERAATAGLIVHTALEPEVQRIAEDAVGAAIRALVGRQGRGGFAGTVERSDREQWLSAAASLRRDDEDAPIPPVPGECFPTLVRRGLSDLGAGPFTFTLDKAERKLPLRLPDGRGSAQVRYATKTGTILRVCLVDEDMVVLDPTPWAQGAAVVMEHGTGEVLAVVGGRGVRLEGFVRATQARRQPGSSFKPYVYAAALLNGRSQLTDISTDPVVVRFGRRVWRPKDGVGGGELSLRNALTYSSNNAAVRLLQEVGAREVVRVAGAMGVSSHLRPDTALALGASEVTPLDQAVGFSTIARLGVPIEPVLIRRLEDPSGPVAEAGQPIHIGGELVGQLPGAVREPALPPGVAYELLDMMRQVVERGTGRAARKKGFDRAGKTGTTNEAIDTWFVGMTPRYTVAVWIGTDIPEGLGWGEAGGRTALPAWTQIIEALPASAEDRFPVPPDVVLVPIGPELVALRRGSAPDTVLPLYPQDGGPLPAFPGSIRD